MNGLMRQSRSALGWGGVVALLAAIPAGAGLADSSFKGPGEPPRQAASMPTGFPSFGVAAGDKSQPASSKEGVTATGMPAITKGDFHEKLSNIVSQDYIIGAEDVLEITVWRNQDLSKVVQVRPDGRVSLPIIRDVTAVGKTPSQLADEIAAQLKPYVQNPAVAIAVRDVNSYSVFLLGEVGKPGKYPLKSKTTLLQAITIAGGFSPQAARNQIVVFRVGDSGNGDQMVKASYDDIVLRGGITQNIELKAGDTIVVPSESMVVFPGR
jgi:polysaccharide export outer membrane protein